MTIGISWEAKPERCQDGRGEQPLSIAGQTNQTRGQQAHDKR